MKIIHLLLAAVISVGAGQAFARATVPVVNHQNVALQRAGGAAPTAADMRQAIVVASQATGRKWAITESAPGQMVATYQVRTHTVVVDILYGPGQLSVTYKDSINMKFGSGGPTNIHPFYNQWVNEFIQAIRLELAKT